MKEWLAIATGYSIIVIDALALNESFAYCTFWAKGGEVQPHRDLIVLFASRHFVGVARLVSYGLNHALADGAGNQRAVVGMFYLAVHQHIEDRDFIRVDDDLAVFGRMPIMKHSGNRASERYYAGISDNNARSGQLQIDIVEEQHPLREPAAIKPHIDFPCPEVRPPAEPRRWRK